MLPQTIRRTERAGYIFVAIRKVSFMALFDHIRALPAMMGDGHSQLYMAALRT